MHGSVWACGGPHVATSPPFSAVVLHFVGVLTVVEIECLFRIYEGAVISYIIQNTLYKTYIISKCVKDKLSLSGFFLNIGVLTTCFFKTTSFKIIVSDWMDCKFS